MELIQKHCISWAGNSLSFRWRCRKFYKNVAPTNSLQLFDLIFFKTEKSAEKASQVKLTRSWIRFQNVTSEKLVTETWHKFIFR